MKKFFLGAAAICALVHSPVSFSQGEYLGQTHRLAGTFVNDEVTYLVTVPLDRVKYPGQDIFAKPEEYKASVTPPFTGGGRQVNCLNGPGVKAWDKAEARGITCTWKAGNGSNFPTNTIQMGLEPVSEDGEAPRFKGFKPDDKTITGSITDSTGLVYPVSLTLDVLDYRNGNNHKVFIKSKKSGDVVDTSSIKEAGAKIKIIGCSSDMKTGGADLIAGSAPKVTCVWKQGKMKREQSPESYGEVTLQ